MLLLTVIGCTNRNVNCTVTLEGLMQQQGDKKLTTFYNKGIIRSVVNMGVDSTNGIYSFDERGYLESYRFFANSEAYTYSEEYDENGKLVHMQGNPFVYNSTELKTKDSIVFKLYFSDLQKQYNDVNITTNAEQSFKLKLVNDSVFTHMKSISFTLNRKGLDHIRVYISTAYQMKCDSTKRPLRDTIALGYIAN
jgi:hypothetical protein